MKVLFLPHCLRNLEQCLNYYNKDGLICNSEHDCSIGKLRTYALDLDYKVYIVPGSSLVEKLVKKLNPTFVVGVACDKEIKIAEQFLDGNYKSVELLLDGCIGTKIDENKVMETLNAN